MKVSMSANKTAHPVSIPCSRIGCSGSARFATMCGGPGFCGMCWRRYLAARSVQYVLSPVRNRTALWWWHCYINSASNEQVGALLYALHTVCSIDVVALVDDIDRRSAELQLAEVLE